MTEAERVLSFINSAADRPIDDEILYLTVKQSRTLKAMLARPVLPEEPPIAALPEMANKITACVSLEEMRDAYRALYAHLTAPKTKEVEVWRVEFAHQTAEGSWLPSSAGPYDTKATAEGVAEGIRKPADNNHCACIRVTGPHKQMVPA